MIQTKDVHTNRTGIQGLLKAFSSKIKSQVSVSFKTVASLEAETQLHMTFLPSTCLLQKKLLLFVSGYRNYAGKSLLLNENFQKMKQPDGSVVLSCFPQIIDNIDIVEVLAEVWSEDVVAKMTAAQKRNIPELIAKVKDTIHKIYPVLFADEFKYGIGNSTESACFNEVKHRMRRELLIAALRRDSVTRGKTAPQLEDMTTFKPFNVRETMWEVWDVKDYKTE